MIPKNIPFLMLLSVLSISIPQIVYASEDASSQEEIEDTDTSEQEAEIESSEEEEVS